MRLVVDTNILVSALLKDTSLSAYLIALWQDGSFTLLICADQLDELMRVTRYPKIKDRITPAAAGRLINELRDLAVMVARLPRVTHCADPHDNYLLAMAQAGAADFLVTGDKRDLLGLGSHEGTRIVTVREFLTLAGKLPWQARFPAPTAPG